MVGMCQCSPHREAPPSPGEWVKGKVIGSGSHGAVHLAMDKTTGALFVVKHANSDKAVESLENEVSILESLDSSHVIRCFGRNLLKGTNRENVVCVFMEYMAGGSLSDIAEKFGGSLDEEVIRLYAKEILHGLNYLHEKGIVHCDLKCKNVLLGTSGNVKLADFGCAQRTRDLNSNEKSSRTTPTFFRGTPLWMAPEVLRKESLGFSSDVWSLGCTVIEMATGRPPWCDDDVSDPMATVLTIACGDKKPQFPAHFSEEGSDFLSRCLERNPERRWTAAQLLDHPFISGDTRKRRSAGSPASVLVVDNGDYEEVYKDLDEESESLDDIDECHFRNPFSNRKCERRIGMNKWEEDGCDSSSKDWITVRSS